MRIPDSSNSCPLSFLTYFFNLLPGQPVTSWGMSLRCPASGVRTTSSTRASLSMRTYCRATTYLLQPPHEGTRHPPPSSSWPQGWTRYRVAPPLPLLLFSCVADSIIQSKAHLIVGAIDGPIVHPCQCVYPFCCLTHLYCVGSPKQFGVDSDKPLPYSHIDIAGSSGPFPGVPTGAPVLAMATHYIKL